MMEEKFQRVSIAAYRDRDFYGGYSDLTISMFVSVKIYGLGKVLKNWRCKLSQFLDIVNLAGEIYNIRHAWTLKKISKTREGVHTGEDNEPALHKWKPMGLTYSKFWLLDLLESSEI